MMSSPKVIARLSLHYIMLSLWQHADTIPVGMYGTSTQHAYSSCILIWLCTEPVPALHQHTCCEAQQGKACVPNPFMYMHTLWRMHERNSQTPNIAGGLSICCKTMYVRVTEWP